MQEQSEIPTLVNRVKTTISAYGISKSELRIRLPGCPVSVARCSIAATYPAPTRHQCITPAGAYPRFLTAIKRTHTSIYVLKLSSDPSITKVPATPGFPSSPYAISGAFRLTRQFESISAAYTRSIRHAVLIPNVSDDGFSPLHASTGFGCVTAPPVSVSPNTFPGGIGSKGNCHSPAPVSAAPASFTRHAAKAVCNDLANRCAGSPPLCVLQLADCLLRPGAWRQGTVGSPPGLRYARWLSPAPISKN